MVLKARDLWIAAPYVTMTQELVEAASHGKSVRLLVGLNESTSPKALSAVHGLPNCAVRYFTHRFHAKIYLFNDEALIGSSNLTDGGLRSNREATICVDMPEDLDELRTLFSELWESAQVLTNEKLAAFTNISESVKRPWPDSNPRIEAAVGRAEPINSSVQSRKQTTERMFLEDLRREVYEQYRPSFSEVTNILGENGFRRPELGSVGPAYGTNRFLNWVRLTYVSGDDAWQSAPFRPTDDRRSEILRLGREWAETESDRSQIPEEYLDWLGNVLVAFGTRDSVDAASKESIMKGLLSVHAFSEQSRFVKGGTPNLPTAFWKANNQDLDKVKGTIAYLIYGTGDFIQRLHDVLFEPARKLGYFGRFCALELFGTVRPDECPPMNGRTAKALRYLGFNVHTG
jgi:hypothetical protein